MKKLAGILLLFISISVTVGGDVSAGPKKLTVVGDSIATGLFFGLRDAQNRKMRIPVERRTRGGTGLAKLSHYDWLAAARRIKRRDRPDLVVISVGGNDRQDIIKGSRRLKRFSKAWWSEYGRRVEIFMRTLSSGRTKAYWVGLPTVSHARMSRDYARLNALYERLAKKNGITYIDTYALTSLGDGMLGSKPLRMKDGIHFTTYGNFTLGRIILRTMGLTS